MVESNPRSAIVYASGMEEKTISRHFSAEESGSLLEYVLDSLWTVADEMIVVFEKEPELRLVEALSPFGVKVLIAKNDQNILERIREAFRLSNSEHCLLTTERAPLLKPNVALRLFENAQGNDLAVPKWKNGRLEPLLSVYRTKAILKLGGSWKGALSGDLATGLNSLIEQLFDVRYVSIEDELAELDPELDSFLSVKDEETLALARSKASVSGKRPLR